MRARTRERRDRTRTERKMPQMAAAHDHQLAPTNRRLRTGSGFEGVSIHSSRHTNAPLSCTTHPDLICHILTSSPSIQIRLLPFSGRSSSAYIPRIHTVLSAGTPYDCPRLLKNKQASNFALSTFNARSLCTVPPSHNPSRTDLSFCYADIRTTSHRLCGTSCSRVYLRCDMPSRPMLPNRAGVRA